MLGRGGELDAAYEVFREMRQSHKVIASNTAITPYTLYPYTSFYNSCVTAVLVLSTVEHATYTCATVLVLYSSIS
jgi:pentatricopeptide repeat protein